MITAELLEGGGGGGAVGVSLALSAADTIVDLDLQTQQSPPLAEQHGGGQGHVALNFGRKRRRLGGGATSVHSTQYIIGHSHHPGLNPSSAAQGTTAATAAAATTSATATTLEPDWRALLGWYVDRHKAWFAPNASATLDFAGGAAQYCDLRLQNYTSSDYRKYGFTMNWDATFAWDWWGNFLPKEEKFERCTCVGHQDGGSSLPMPFSCFENGSRADGFDPSDPAAPCEQLSRAEVASWYARAKAQGVATLLYQDPNEWGAQVVPASQPIDHLCGTAAANNNSNSSTFCVVNRLFKKSFEPAALSKDAKPYAVGYITQGLILLDALHKPYQDWIVEMAGRMVKELPVAGIAWDRSDHTSQLNGRLNDGIAWDATAAATADAAGAAAGAAAAGTAAGTAAGDANAGICSWLGSGWQQVVARVAEVFHDRGLAMVHNTYANRLDFNRHMDGISPLNKSAHLYNHSLIWTGIYYTI
jgi:hypothetical protein